MLFTLIRAFPAFALQNKPDKAPEQFISVIQEKLTLTDDKVRQIRPILNGQAESRYLIFGRYRSHKNIDRSAMRTESLLNEGRQGAKRL
jgi:hypothetical protein